MIYLTFFVNHFYQEQHENVDRMAELSLGRDEESNKTVITSTSSSSQQEGVICSIGGIDCELTREESEMAVDELALAGASCEAPVENELALLEKKRSYVFHELVETERQYIIDLKEIVEGYMRIMRDPNSEIPMPEDLRGGRDKMVFGNLEAIYEWHRE